VAEFRDPADAAYGIARADFRKQMALLRAAGYHTITLEQFRRFRAGLDAALPPRPLLLTFDDGLAGSLAGADATLRELGWTAVMFIDVGAVEASTPGYAGWERLRAAQRSGRWDLQLHAGGGHHNIANDARGTLGPFYANRLGGRERLRDWWRRVRRDIEWGEARLRDEVPGYRRMAFAPPYGNFGQLATNDRRIPERLGGWLRRRFGLVFVQDPARYARVGDPYPPRLQITRRMSGGDIHAWLERELAG
jgi:peptidoglycan/xylan/chitin deacetylase (PgdA/CDA1 family)